MYTVKRELHKKQASSMILNLMPKWRINILLSTHGTFIKTDHVLSYKTNLKKVKKKFIII